MHIKGIKNPITYKHQKIFLYIVCALLIVGACLTIGTNTTLLQAAHQTVISETDKYISELSHSVRNALQDRFQRTLMLLESVARCCDLESTLSAEEQKELQERAELLQFQYFAFVFPDGSAICSDGIPRTFDRQDGIMKAFDGQPVIDVKIPAAADEQNRELPFFAVPIYSHRGAGEIAAILAAPILPEWTDSFLTQSYYDEDLFFDIIRSDGTEVFMTERSPISWFDKLRDSNGETNLFDILYANAEIISDASTDDLREAAAMGRDATIRFQLPNDQLIYTAQLAHIGGTDLCIWMVDANDAISEGLHQILHRATGVNTLGTICFIALLFTLIFLCRKNMSMLMEDPVTGGYSPSRFTQEATHLIQHSTPGDYTFIVMNTANFKLFNDIYGRDESDRILKHIYNIMLKYMEEGELLVRSSADNFNMLIRTTSQEVIIQKLDIIVDEINQFNNDLQEKQCLMFKAGVYQIVDTTLSVVDIRDRANIAQKKMMMMPTEGILFSCGFYEEEDRIRLQQENLLINKMDDALKNQDFKVYLQPKVDISTGRIISAEALVRWKDADMGLVPPDEFIPLFERTGFIRQLDLYMWEQVCICLRRWLDAKLQPIPVSVNLSRLHLMNRDFLAPFIEVQKKYCIPPELLELELTETAFQDAPDAIPEAITQIHLAGYTCSLDDFGSGYSSLNNLEMLDIDVVKLDCKFLRNARVENDKGHILIEDLIHMAKHLGITVCCEGVETDAHHAFLKKCHCDIGQGYLFSKPIEVSAFEQILFGDLS